MRNKQFLRGVVILDDHMPADGLDITAEHDQIWLFADVGPAAKKELEELGWFIDEDVGENAWSAFV